MPTTTPDAPDATPPRLIDALSALDVLHPHGTTYTTPDGRLGWRHPDAERPRERAAWAAAFGGITTPTHPGRGGARLA